MASRPIDEKIVVMKMDNSDLHKKAAETTTIFGKLKQTFSNVGSVSMDKLAGGLGRIQNAARNADLTPLANSVDQIASRFSNLGIVATTALVNITNRAVDAGLRISRSLSTEQVMSGFREYELKMGSIQTMLSNTEWAGSTLDDVKKTLGELNTYADKTIYSFAEMTANIGRFTAAGVTLEDSAIAIKGLGNLAAISGSNTQQLNTAMYQMSQALASGKLNLMDWNSLVNAGMAGKKTQDALVATAKAMGKTVDMTEGFRNSIQDGWLTSEVFLETLKKFGKDESMTEAATSVRTFTGMMDALKEGIGSGWAETWEIVFGDFEEATEFWTKISKALNSVFDKSTVARNDLLRAVFDDGGMNAVLESLQNAFKPIGQVMGAVKDGFRAIFAPLTVKQIKEMVAGLVEFTSHLKLSDKNVESLKTIFEGLFAVLSTGWEILKLLGKSLMGAAPGFESLLTNVLSLGAKVAELPIFINNLIKSEESLSNTTSFLSKIFEGVAVAVSAAVGGMVDFAGAVSQLWQIMANGNFTDGPWSETSMVVEWAFKIRESVGGMISYLNGLDIGGFIAATFGTIGDTMETLNNVFDKVVTFFKELPGLIQDNPGWVLAGGGLAGLIAIGWKMWTFFDGLIGNMSRIGEILEGVGDALGAFTLGIHVKSLLTIAVAVGILAISFRMLQDLDGKQIANGLYVIVGSLGAMVGALAIMNKYDIGGSFGATFAMIGMAVAVVIIAEAMQKMAELNPQELTKGVIGLIGIMGSLAGAFALIGKFGGVAMTISAMQFLGIAGAVYILLFAVEKIAGIDIPTLVKGTITLGVLLAQMAIFLRVSSGSALNMGAAVGLVAVAGSILMITNAIKKLGEIEPEKLKQGLVAVTIILAELTLLSRLTANVGMFAAGAGILLMAGAINALVLPITLLGNTDIKTLAIGIGAIGIAMVAMGAASSLMGGLIPAAIGVGIMAVSMMALTAPIATFGSMKWGTILKGIGTLVLIMASLGGTALLLSPAVIPLLAFSAALTILGLGMLAAGAGMSLFAKGLIVLAGLTSGAVVAIVATIGSLLAGFAALAPAAADLLYKLMISITEIMSKNAPILIDKVAELIGKIKDKIVEYAPKFMDGAVDILVAFLDGLEIQIPRVIERVTTFVINMTNAMATAIEENGGPMIDAMMRLMGEIIILMIDAGTQVITALFGWIPGVNDAMTSIATNAEATVRENFGAKEAGEDKGIDFANALASTSGAAGVAGAEVGAAGKAGANSANLTTVGGTKGTDFATALASKTGSAQTSGTALANAGKTGAGSVSMSTTGSEFGTGFANGIDTESVLGKVASAAKNLALKARDKVRDWLDMHSPSRVAMKDGSFFGEGFAIGIADKIKAVGNSAKNLAMSANANVNKFLESFSMPVDNNELTLRVNVEYNGTEFNPNSLNVPAKIVPDTSWTNGLIASTKVNQQRSKAPVVQPEPMKSNNDSEKDNDTQKQPAIIQVVTPEKRELARWLVDDITEFQDFKIATTTQF